MKSGGGTAVGTPASGDFRMAHKLEEKDQSCKTRDLSFGLVQ